MDVQRFESIAENHHDMPSLLKRCGARLEARENPAGLSQGYSTRRTVMSESQHVKASCVTELHPVW